MPRTLLIDDVREIDATVVARSYEYGIYCLQHSEPFDTLLLDHDLNGIMLLGENHTEKTGLDVLRWLRANPQYLPKEIVLITANPVGRERMLWEMREMVMYDNLDFVF